MLLGLCAVSAAAADAYPNRPVRLVVPTGAGGNTDTFARIVADKLKGQLGQQVIVDNRTGASGIVGSDIVAKAAPDGYTLLMAFPSHPVNPSLYSDLPYDTLKDFAPVTTATAVSYVLVVHPAVAAKTVPEFIALAKAKPGQLRFGSAGAGSVTHLGVELLKSMAGIDLVHVPYKGAGPAMIDLLGGQLDFMFDSLLTSTPLVKAGKLRALGQSGLKRSAILPDVPTIAESALPGFDVSTWFGLVAPAKTPRDIVVKLNQAAVKGLQNPATRERLLNQGIEPVGNSPEEFAKLLRTELPKWARVVKISGAKQD